MSAGWSNSIMLGAPHEVYKVQFNSQAFENPLSVHIWAVKQAASFLGIL